MLFCRTATVMENWTVTISRPFTNWEDMGVAVFPYRMITSLATNSVRPLLEI